MSRSTIEATKPLVAAGARLEVDNTVLRGPFTDGVRGGVRRGRSSQFFGDHLTIVGDGSGTGLRADCDGAGLSAYASLENTVIAGVDRPWFRVTQAGGIGRRPRPRLLGLPRRGRRGRRAGQHVARRHRRRRRPASRPTAFAPGPGRR